jgi:spore germination cell wall hydrolase CwlJ-like protein
MRQSSSKNKLLFWLSVAFMTIIGLQMGKEYILSPTGQALCMAKNVYWESRLQSFRGKWGVAYVTAHRTHLNRSYWGGSTHCGVVYKRRGRTAQFSWTTKKYLVAREPPSFEDRAGWILSVLATRFVEWTGWAPQGFEEATFYMNPIASDHSQYCWFKENLISIGFIGDHEFYREPRKSEKKSGPAPECSKTPVADTSSVPLPKPRPT